MTRTRNVSEYRLVLAPCLVQYSNSRGNICKDGTFADENKNSSGDEIANVNFFYNIAHVEASAYAH